MHAERMVGGGVVMRRRGELCSDTESYARLATCYARLQGFMRG